MPDINQYTFTLKEAAAALVKQANIHEGRWMLVLGLSFSGGNFGPAEDQVAPGALISIPNLLLQKAGPGSPASLVVDAAEVNPPST